MATSSRSGPSEEHPLAPFQDDPQADLLREMYWARDTAALARLETSEVRHRLLDLAAQLRTDEKLMVPMGEGNLASASRWRRRIKFAVWIVIRPATWRYDRLIADHAELTTNLAERLMLLEAEVDRLKGSAEGGDGLTDLSGQEERG